MNARVRLGIIVGSLRKESWSRKLAGALIARAPEDFCCELIEIGDLPLYNADLDTRPPAAWTALRKTIKRIDAILFVTPEYNRSIPGCLKNAIDVGSRPEGANVFAGLPAGVVSTTPYQMGAFGANHALRQTFVFLDMPVMQQPEAYIGRIDTLLDASGQPKSHKTAKILTDFMNAFSEWITKVRAHPIAAFNSFLEERDRISTAYIKGDAGPLRTILTRREPATFFAPDGHCVKGTAAVSRSYVAGAKAFMPGSTGRLDILQRGTTSDLAFWTGIQHAQVRMKGKDNPVEMALRTTEIFRFEEGGWKLVHRHADFAK